MKSDGGSRGMEAWLICGELQEYSGGIPFLPVQLLEGQYQGRIEISNLRSSAESTGTGLGRGGNLQEGFWKIPPAQFLDE